MFEYEKQVGSDTIYFFKNFMIIRAMLVALTYALKYMTNITYEGDIKLWASVFTSAVLDGLEIMINVAIPVPFASFTMEDMWFHLDFVAVFTFIISFGIAFLLYNNRKRASEWRYY